MRSILSLSLLVVSAWFVGARTSDAVQPADVLVPATTKGFLSVPDMDELQARFNETQLGELMNDPIMQPFTEDLKKQLRDKLTKSGRRLGLTLEDVDGVYGGEVAVAVIQPKNDLKQHAMAIVVDVTDRAAEANELLAKIARNMAEQRATRATGTVAGIPLTVYTMPLQRGETKAEQTILMLHDHQLVSVDHLEEARAIAARLAGQGDGATLATVPAYVETMRRTGEAAEGREPHARWFVEPFGYVEVNRAASGGRRTRGTDLLKVLKNQGFDAVQGAAGYVNFSTDKHEMLHRSFVYAPPIQLEDGSTARERYRLAARMLQFPNQESLAAQPWIPRELGTYVTFNWKMIDAFHFSKTLVDELAGAEGVFEDVLEGIKHDPDGPQVDVVNDLVAHFGERATLLGDAKLPITPESERLMFAIELTDAAAARQTIDKAMRNDPNAKRRMFGEQVIWEIINEEADDVPQLQIDGAFAAPGPDLDEEKGVLPNSAITVAHGHMLIASHVDFIVDLLKHQNERDSLSQAADYQLVKAALTDLGADVDSFRAFARTDDAYRVTYELLRQNQMPESRSLFGRMLNRMFGSEEKDATRAQEIDGSKMPEFQAVRRYLGPAGLFVRSHEDGWFVTGVLLHKEAAR